MNTTFDKLKVLLYLCVIKHTKSKRAFVFFDNGWVKIKQIHWKMQKNGSKKRG